MLTKAVFIWNSHILKYYYSYDTTVFLVNYSLKCNIYLVPEAEFSSSLLSLQCHMIVQKSF